MYNEKPIVQRSVPARVSPCQCPGLPM